MRFFPTLLISALLVLPLHAQQAPDPEPRPEDEPQRNAVMQGAATAAFYALVDAVAEMEVPLPRPRPEDRPVTAPLETTETETVAPEEPEADEPPRVYQTACPAVLSGSVAAEALPPLSEGSCGERSPLSVTAVLVHGRMVPLSTPAVVNCAMASTLPAWAEAIDGYLFSRENTRLQEIGVGTSYMCRNRNNAESGDTSEHGFADAVDVTGFGLEDGRTVAVETGWPDEASDEGRLLRFAHDSACSQFTTTLGPEANALHFDHLHLDLGCHGVTCTARLCE